MTAYANRTTVSFQKVVKAESIPSLAEQVNLLMGRVRASGLEYNVKMDCTNPEALKKRKETLFNFHSFIQPARVSTEQA